MAGLEGMIALSRTLADAIRIRTNFARSVNIERDSREWLSDQARYIFTPLARQTLGQVVDAILSPHGTRSWTITGPYGTGKSAFALALVQLLGRHGPASSLFKEVVLQDPELASGLAKVHEYGYDFLPVLISGLRDSLVPALHAGLESAVQEAVRQTGSEEGLALLDRIRSADCQNAAGVCALFEQAAKLWNGLIVIIDELGKFLEYVAQRPDRGDVFVLQLLAEGAARSGTPPLLLFTVLHQSFSRYSSHLTQTQREEFGKVQGRFQDIAFSQTYDQMMRLASAAVELVGTDNELSLLHKTASRLEQRARLLGVSLGFSDSSRDDIATCPPLHPVTALLLGPLFRHLAQNERSLFAFLSSSEPYGLQDFMRRTTFDQSDVPFYTPDQLYDYVTCSLGTALYHERTGRRWALVQSTLDRLRHVDALDVRIIKTVGLMAAIGEINDLRATPELVALALDLSLEETQVALERLVRKSALVYRSFVQAYHLWDGSDIDLEARLKEARYHVDEAQSLDELLTRLLPPRPIVARRFSFSTGTMRFFETLYVSAPNVQRAVRTGATEGDGLVVYVLVEGAGQLEHVQATMHQPEIAQNNRVIVVPIHVPPALRGAALELQRLKWVLNNTPELANDNVALTELRSRMFETEQILLRELDYAVSPADRELECFFRGETRTVRGWRALNQLVSEACQLIFPLTPTISNELINRRSLSSAASAARRNLLDRMLQYQEVARLGIERHPPELSMYLSLLKTTRVHREVSGVWRFASPEEGTPLAPVWNEWETFLESSRHQRQSLKLLWDRLSAPPYGLLGGVIPVLILAMLLERSIEVGLYESGTFIPSLTLPHVERLLKTPEKFEIRFCPLDGIRRDVFDELAAIGLSTERGHLIPVVRQLCGLAHRLPEYSKKTKSVTVEAQRVRSALLSAREPDVLVFEQLPEALGLPSMLLDTPTAKPREFAQRLAGTLQELQMAHPRLHDHMFTLMGTYLDVPTTNPALTRQELQFRCRLVTDMAVDLRMKSFVRHCSNERHDYSTWMESLGSFLGNRPPSTWNDDDLNRFEAELTQMARKFNNLVQLAIGTAAFPDAGLDAVRLGLTGTDGFEKQKVIFLRPENREAATETVNEITQLLERQGIDTEGRLAVLALLAKAWLPEPKETA